MENSELGNQCREQNWALLFWNRRNWQHVLAGVQNFYGSMTGYSVSPSLSTLMRVFIEVILSQSNHCIVGI